MSELFLILHKVRGEPAFDIAQQIEIGKELGWIIPTSGHRAYPYWTCPLTHLNSIDNDMVASHIVSETTHVDMPTDLPDHYEAKRDDGHHLVDAAREILMRKGLISAAKPTQPTFRRF